MGDFEQPCLYFVSGSDVDGDPNMPIAQKFFIRTRKKFESKETRFQYQMLGRLLADCEYYLGWGNRDTERLWAKDEKEQIEEMKKIWNIISEDKKPKWLTWEQIVAYEKKIVHPFPMIEATGKNS